MPWTEAEIAAAKAECKELLTGDPPRLRAAPADQGRPVRDAGAGPGPRDRHRSEGRDRSAGDHELPDGEALLGEWLRDTVQPEAKSCLGSTVVKMHNATLLCLPQPLWRRQHAVERACARQRVRRVRVRARQRQAHHGAGRLAEDRRRLPLRPKRIRTAHRTRRRTRAATKPEPADKAESVGPPRRAPSPPPRPSRRARPHRRRPPRNRSSTQGKFVTFVHDDACQRFGTVLGPDANAAHKNHFHLDMKKRRRGFCE